MKKFLTLFFILSNICFASAFKYYRYVTIESCVNKLNELSQTYKIISYQIVPAQTGGNDIKELYHYNMVIEVEDK